MGAQKNRLIEMFFLVENLFLIVTLIWRPVFINRYEPRSDRRDLLAIKVKSEIFTEKDLAVMNNYRKFEEIIFTNNKDMSV